MDDHYVDPEVQADIDLRESTRRERSPARLEVYNWTEPRIVDRWRCRGNCGGIVAVTEEAQHALEVHNRELANRGETPLDTNKIAFCEKCREQGVGIGAERNRRHVDALALIIGELVQMAADNSQDHDRERTLMHNAKLMHHPDLDGLKQALRDRREKGKETKNKPRRGA